MAESIICRASSPFPEKTNFAKNWYFINPINSKGKKEYTEYGEIIDGWVTASWYSENTPKTSFKLTDQGLLITPGANKTILHQIIDDDLFFNFLVGKYVTVTVVTSDGDQAVLTLIPDATSTMETVKARFQHRNDYQIIMYRWGGWLGNKPNIQIGSLDNAQPIYLLGVCIEIGSSSTFTYQDAEGKWRIKHPIYNKPLEMIRTNDGVVRYALQTNADIIGNANHPYSYETIADINACNLIGIDTTAFYCVIKYFPNYRSDGYGIQLAFRHDSDIMLFRTSHGNTWNAWNTVYTNRNLNPDTIGAAWANHTHDVVALGGGKIISGTYTGDGATPNGTEVGVSNPRFINLGITPKAVLVLAKGINVTYNEGHEYCRGGMATTGSPAIGREGNYVLSVATNGFYVYKETKGSNWMSFSQTNEEGVLYNYIALI